MSVHYYFRALFVLLGMSVLLTEQRHGFGQIVFVYGAYVISYYINKILFRPDLMSAIHRQAKATKSFFFRGEHYETMNEIAVEKTFLATTGSSGRVQATRWATRGLFAAFVFAFYSLHKSGKVVSTAIGLFHLLIASTFLPMESLSHSLLPLGLNIVLVCFYLAYHKAEPSFMIAFYFTAMFVTFGLYGYSFVTKKFSTRENLNLRLRSSLRLLALWAVMATILYLVLPGESIKELIRGPVENLEKVVEQKFDEHVMPALQKAADSQLPNFDQINQQAENNPSAPSRPSRTMPTKEEVKAVQEKMAEAIKRGGMENPTSSQGGELTAGDQGYTDIQQAEANTQEEFDKLKKQLEEFSKLPAQQQQAQLEELKKMNEQLRQIEEAVDKNTGDGPETEQQVGQQVGQQAGQQTGQPPGAQKAPNTPSAQSAQTTAKLPEPPKPPKLELPKLDRWWPLLKLLGFFFMIYVIYVIASPFLQKNDERKAQEKKLSKKDKAKLRAFLKHTQETQYKNERDEVIRKYHAFLEVMEFIHRPRHESLPPEDFGEFLKQDLRRNLQELDSLTWGFSDVLYGDKELEPERMNHFRKSFNEMARSFLDIS